MLTPSKLITYLLTFIPLYSLPQSGLSWRTGFGRYLTLTNVHFLMKAEVDR